MGGWGDHNPVMKTFKRMWIILEPVIFALIGTEIQVHKIDFAVLGYSLIVLIGALVIRMIGTYFAVTCGTLTTKDKIFMAFAWLPKATVQAALGPIFLDNVLKQNQKFWVDVTGDVCCDENWRRNRHVRVRELDARRLDLDKGGVDRVGGEHPHLGGPLHPYHRPPWAQAPGGRPDQDGR